MKLNCSRDELSKALQSVLRSVGVRAGIPALSGVLMDLGDQLSLTTTDLELTTRVTLPVTGDPGQAVVPARLLSEIVRNLPGDDVTLVREDGSMEVSAGRARFSLRSLPAEDFPRVHDTDEGRTLELDGEMLRRALAQVVVAASRDETRPVLTGVLIEPGETDQLRLVATDSYRLAVRRIAVAGAGDLKMLVPARAVQEVVRLVSGSEPVRLRSSAAQVSFETGSVVLRSRLIEGEFPAYDKLFPEHLPCSLEADRESFVESLRRVAVVAQDATPVWVELDESDVRFTCHSQGLGEASESVDAEYKGDPMRIAFNPGYLSNGIEAVEDERVRIEIADHQRPVVVRGTTDDQFQYLLMPVRMS